MRTRFTLACALVAACAVAAFFVPAAFSVSHAEREAQVVELQQEASDVAVMSASGRLRMPATADADDPLEAAKRRGREAHDYAVYAPDGRRVEGTGPRRLEPSLVAALGGHARSSRDAGLAVVAVPLPDGRALRASEPGSEADDRARAAVGKLAGAGLLLIIAAPLLAWLVAGRLLRPMRDLADVARRVGGGDFSVAAPAAGIREVDEVAEALNTSAERIGQLIQRERQLTADTSHQLRTPLAGLRLSLEGELANPGGDPARILEESLGAVHRLEETVAQLAALARGEAPAAATPLSVREALDQARDRWADTYARADRALEATGAPGARSDVRPSAVDAVLDVLIDNALRHGTGAVTLGLRPDDGGIVVTVADQGTCVLTDVELFARRSSTAGSTGIGLHLARTLATGEGGRLRLSRSDPTEFSLELPSS